MDFLLSISAHLHPNKQQWLRGLNEINLFTALVLLYLNVTFISVYTSNQVLRLHEKVFACRRSQALILVWSAEEFHSQAVLHSFRVHYGIVAPSLHNDDLRDGCVNYNGGTLEL